MGVLNGGDGVSFTGDGATSFIPVGAVWFVMKEVPEPGCGEMHLNPTLPTRFNDVFLGLSGGNGDVAPVLGAADEKL